MTKLGFIRKFRPKQFRKIDCSSKTVRHGGIKTRSTRTVRKVTTVTRGEQSVTSESIMRYGSDNSQTYPSVAHDKKSLKFRVVDKVH
jgi:hypothetical protein